MAINENATVGIYLNTEDAEKRLKELQLNAVELKQKLDQMGKGSPERKEAQRQLRDMKKEIKGVQEALSKKVDVVINGQMAGASIRDLQDASRKLWNEIRKLSPETQEFVEKSKRLQEVEGRLKSLRDQAKGTSGFWSRMKDEMKAFGVMALGFLGFQALVGQIQNVIQRNVQLSDSMADVMKTTGMTKSEVESLNRELGKLNTRTSRQELLALATDAGKLGITGKENVMGFVRAADKINVALGEDLGEGAVRNIGKLNDLFKVREAYGYEQGMLKIGSAINSLGQSSTASESYLVEFTKRLGGVATQTNISIENILGLGATLDSLGQQAETSSTAVGQLLVDMFKSPSDYASIAKMNIEEFTQLLEKDANEAFLKVLEGLQGNNEGFTVLAQKLQQVGVDGSRGTAVLSTLAGNVKMLRSQQTLSNEEFQKGTSIMQEFNTKNENFAAKWEKFLKNIGRLFTNSTVTGAMESFVDLFNVILDRTPQLDKLTASFTKQKVAVDNYEKSILPLINRYDELKAKTNPTADEQEELKKIIEKISLTIPTAITQFDEYGKAMDINSDKARKYGENLKFALQYKNREALQQAKEDLADITEEIEKAQRALSTRDSEGDIIKKVAYSVKSAGGEFQTFTKDVKMSASEITAFQAKLTDLQGQQTGIQISINELAGEELFKIPQAVDNINSAIEENQPENFELSISDNFVTNTEKLVEQLRDLKIQAIDDEETREKAALKAKLDRQKSEVSALEADEKVKSEVLYQLQEQYQIDLKQLEERYAKEKNEAKFQRESQDLSAWFEKEKLLLVENLNAGEISETEYKTKLKKLEKDFLDEKKNLAIAHGQDVVAIEQQIQEQIRQDNQNTLTEEKAKRRAHLEFVLQHSKAGSREQLEARIAILTEQLHSELENTSLSAEEQQLIWKSYYDTVEQMNADFLAGKMQQAQVYVNQFLNLFNGISALMANEAERELARDRKVNDEKKKNLKAQLDSKRISEGQYRSKVQALDEAYEKKAAALKRKAFEREKLAKTISAIINTAVGVTTALSSAPPPYNFVLAALTAAAGAIEIATIQSAPVPEFERGRKPITSGIVKGPSHSQQGIRLIDSQTGKVVGEMEGDEGIFSRKMYANNKDIIDAIFAAGGAPVSEAEKEYQKSGIGLASLIPSDRLDQMKEAMLQLTESSSLTEQTETMRNFRETTTEIVRMNREKSEIISRFRDQSPQVSSSTGSLEGMIASLNEAAISISDRNLLRVQQSEYFKRAVMLISENEDGNLPREQMEVGLKELENQLRLRTISNSTEPAVLPTTTGTERLLMQRSVVSRVADPVSEIPAFTTPSISWPEIPAWKDQPVPAINSERIVENLRLEESLRTLSVVDQIRQEFPQFGQSTSIEPQKQQSNPQNVDLNPTLMQLNQVLSELRRHGVVGVWEHRSWREGLDDIEEIQAKARF